MFKRIRAFMLKDIVNAMRDNIIIYGTLFPLLLALIMGFFIPNIQDMKLTVAVSSELDTYVVDGLKQYADVEIFENRADVEKRVQKSDDLAGIVKDGNEFVILLEGNEGKDSGEIAQALMKNIVSEPTGVYKHESLGKANSTLREISGGLLLLTSILIGGYIIGFNIVNEKETKAVKAISLTPLRTSEFILSHTIICVLFSVILGVLASFILVRGSIDYSQVVVSLIATSGIGMILGFIIGALADSLISAIAVVKFEMLIFVGVPIASLFTPEHFQKVYYPFPNYWAFQSYLNIFNGGNQPVGFTISTLLAFGISVVILIALVPMLKRRLTLR